MTKYNVIEYRSEKGETLFQSMPERGKWRVVPASADMDTIMEMGRAITDILKSENTRLELLGLPESNNHVEQTPPS